MLLDTVAMENHSALRAARARQPSLDPSNEVADFKMVGNGVELLNICVSVSRKYMYELESG